MSMKSALNLSIFLIALLINDTKSLSLTDYQIKIICKKKKGYLSAEKFIREKIYLEKGNQIEIP